MERSHDSFEQALRRYRADEFTDDDVTRCAGLSARSTRELIKLGFVRTRRGDRGAGHIRIYDATTLKRLAVVAAINSAGFSLLLASRMAYLLPGDNQLYQTYDPINVLCDTTGRGAATSELPPRLERAWYDWFDSDQPAAADPANDRLLEIYNGRFVALVFKDRSGPLIYGNLRKVGTEFVSWWPFQSQTSAMISTDAEIGPKWEDPRSWADRIDPRFLDYRYEDHPDGDPLMLQACSASRNPVFKTSINITLAIRLALRRYLGLEPPLLHDAGS